MAAFLPQRYRVLDAYRFMAAIGVVWYHYEMHYQAYLPQPTQVFERFPLFVDFFFVLSGFVLMQTYGAGVDSLALYGTFLRKRLARIWPLHAVMTLAFAALGIVVLWLGLPQRYPGALDPAAAPAHLLMIHAWGIGLLPALNVPSWSISAQFFVYLLYPLLALVVLRIGTWRALLLAFSLGLVMTITRESSGLRPWEQTTFDFGNLRALPSFLAGMAVQQIVASDCLPKLSLRIAHTAALAMAALMLLHLPELIIVALFLGLVGMLAQAERSGAPSRLARGIWGKLGDASYGIYLLHSFVILLSLAVLRRFGLPSVLAMMVLALAGTLGTTLLAMASFRWFENPARLWLRGVQRPTGAIVSIPAE